MEFVTQHAAAATSVSDQCHLVATSVGEEEELSETTLATFFCRVATAFGQDSDGKIEAKDLLQLLSSKHIDTTTLTNNQKSYHLTSFMFEGWLNERFAEHPQHLEELVRVARDMHAEKEKEKKKKKKKKTTILTSTSTTFEDEEKDLKKQLLTCHEHNQKMKEENQTLRMEKAVLHQKVQDVSNHHSKILKSALASARKERTYALRTGKKILFTRIAYYSRYYLFILNIPLTYKFLFFANQIIVYFLC